MAEDRIERAFQNVRRAQFLPKNKRSLDSIDAPLPVGYGQTNSQPSTVADMLEWLDAQPGQHVLDVGSGSGWTTALLGYLVGPEGDVTAVEIVPELVEFGQQNCERAGIENVQFHHAGDFLGWPESQPYDRILVSASAGQLPDELIDQLRAPGKMAIPVGETIMEITKTQQGNIEIIGHAGYVFVPLL
jgi:protein-L-isoaspartate(D-aspartate) O-methyltransferase